MTMIFRVTIQGNVPYNGGNSFTQPVNASGNTPQGYTSCREVSVVTNTILDAVQLVRPTLKPTEVITNIYSTSDEVIIDPQCVPRG